MSLKSSIALLVVVSQLVSFSAFAEPSSSATTTASAEFFFLQDTVALEGMILTPDEQRNQLNTILSQYLATAQPDGQVERMRQALVDLNIMTSEQADAIVADARTMNTEFSASAPLQQQNDVLTHAIVQLVANHPLMGAQFSACEVGGAIGLSGLGLIGFVEIASKAGMTIGSQNFSGLAYIGLGTVITLAGAVVMVSSCF